MAGKQPSLFTMCNKPKVFLLFEVGVKTIGSDTILVLIRRVIYPVAMCNRNVFSLQGDVE